MLGERHQADQRSKQDAVPERGTQHFALLAQQPDRRHTDGYILRGNHLSGYGAGRICCGQ
jgi:hypothetical protein